MIMTMTTTTMMMKWMTQHHYNIAAGLRLSSASTQRSTVPTLNIYTMDCVIIFVGLYFLYYIYFLFIV